MDLLDNTAPMLRTVARIAGIKSIRATTDTPAASIELSYHHKGQEHKSTFTLQDLLGVFTEQATVARTPPPSGYIDLADVP